MAGTAVAIAHVKPLEKGCKLHPSASLSMNREPGKKYLPDLHHWHFPSRAKNGIRGSQQQNIDAIIQAMRYSVSKADGGAAGRI
jgi:hypothetical protein